MFALHKVTPESFDMIFGSAKLLYVASVVAYLLGSLSDIWLFGVTCKLHAFILFSNRVVNRVVWLTSRLLRRRPTATISGYELRVRQVTESISTLILIYSTSI